jgi:hypothetical protein
VTSEPRPPRLTPDVAEFDGAIRSYLERMAALRFPDASIALAYTCDGWPPPAETVLGGGPVHAYSGRLTGFPDGHLAVTLERDDGTPSLEAAFQRVALSGSTFLILVTVKDERLALKVHGHELGPYDPAQDALEIRGTPG